MILIRKPEDCCGCGACAAACPKNCITMSQDCEGFYYPRIDTERCISCGQCERVCPFRDVKQQGVAIQAYASKNLDEKVRAGSSSGGIFSALAMEVLAMGGYVYGAALDDDCRHVRHIRVDSIGQLDKLRGSKYVQADPVTLYEQIQRELERKTPVLFSGTACQVNALYRFLGKNDENLFCVDIICHGVPSQKLWEKYVEYMETQYRGKMYSADFRCKKYGWRDFGLKSHLDKNRSAYKTKDTDPYMQMFLKDRSLRPSCYACKAKTIRSSDITLADFWGIQRVLPDYDDGMGVSLVLVRSEKGMRLFNGAQGIEAIPVDLEKSIQTNSMEYESAVMPPERSTLYTDMKNIPFCRLARKYGKPDYKQAFKNYLRRTKIWKAWKIAAGRQ